MTNTEEAKDMLLEFCSHFSLEIASPMCAKGMEHIENEFFVFALESWHACSIEAKEMKKLLIVSGKQSSFSHDLMQQNEEGIRALIFRYLN